MRTVAPHLRLFPLVGILPACVDAIARDDSPESRVFDNTVIMCIKSRNARCKVSGDLCSSLDVLRLCFAHIQKYRHGGSTTMHMYL